MPTIPQALSVAASASVLVTAVVLNACSIGSTSGAGGGGAVIGGGDFCSAAKVAQKAQSSAASQLTVDSPAQVEKFEKRAIAELQTFVSIAPSAIKSDVTVIANANQKLYSALEAAHFEFSKIKQNSLVALLNPAFTQATAHVEAYLTRACGIDVSPTS